MKWWGWGDPERRLEVGAGAIAALRSEVGEAQPEEHVSLESVAIPASLPLPPSIAEAVGEAAVLDSHEHRVRRAAGRGYPDLVRLRESFSPLWDSTASWHPPSVNRPESSASAWRSVRRRAVCGTWCSAKR